MKRFETCLCVCIGIPIFGTSQGNRNCFEKSVVEKSRVALAEIKPKGNRFLIGGKFEKSRVRKIGIPRYLRKISLSSIHSKINLWIICFFPSGNILKYLARFFLPYFFWVKLSYTLRHQIISKQFLNQL